MFWRVFPSVFFFFFIFSKNIFFRFSLKINTNENFDKNLLQKSLENVWRVQKPAVLLHSLNGTRHTPSNVQAIVL